MWRWWEDQTVFCWQEVLTFWYLDGRSLAIVLYCYFASIVNVGVKEISCCCTSFSESSLLTSGGKYGANTHARTYKQVNNYVLFCFFLTLSQNFLRWHYFPLLQWTISTFSPSARRLWTLCSSAATCCWRWRAWSSWWHSSCCFPFISWSRSMPRP